MNPKTPSLGVPAALSSGPASPDRPAVKLEPVARTLLDLMSEAFYLLLLLKRGQTPTDATLFVQQVRDLLDTVERNAMKLGIAGEDIYAAKYAYCAAIDEAILSTPCAVREDWELQPLQLILFGDHLAGEHFFTRLEELRAQGAARLQALEVYYFILLLGFEGKYRLEGPEKLGYLTARLGDEITYLKGRRAAFAPHWAPPDAVAHAIRRQAPMWLPVLAVAVLGVAGYLVLAHALSRDTHQAMAAHQDVVSVPPRTAQVTITLP